MSGAANALQTAIVARLEERSSLAGTFNDVPARASFPYVVVNCGDESKWNCIGRTGREIALQLVIWDDEPARLIELENEVEKLAFSVRTSSPWHLSSLVLRGKQRSRQPGHAGSCEIAFRARVIEEFLGAAI